MTNAAAVPRPRSTVYGWLARWETVLIVTIVFLLFLGNELSPFFLTPGNFGNLTAALMEVAIMALPMTLIIIAGEIDLSVESMAGLSSSLLGYLFASGVPLELAIPAVLVVGALGGLLNGLLIARAGLPSLVVTLGTLALFRGLALVVLGPRGISNFPPAFTELGFGHVPGTVIPWPLVIFLSLALVFAIVLHRTWIGRHIFAIGKNTEAARYSGVRVVRTKVSLFVLSGVIASFAGVILTSRLSTARADAGEGLTLVVVTAVLLGGVNIFGGSGSIPGVVLAVFALAMLQNALRLASVTAETQSIAVGSLLVISVAIPTFAHQVQSVIERVRGGRHPPPRSMAPDGSPPVQ